MARRRPFTPPWGVSWLGLLVLLAGVALVTIHRRTGLPDLLLHEAGDSAGDALQVRRGLEDRWFPVGVHTDTGHPHPGPAGLWVKALATLAHRAGLGGSEYATILLTFSVLRVVFLVAAMRAVAVSFNSRLAGVALGLGALLWMPVEQSMRLDPGGAALHFFLPFPVLLLFAELVRCGATKRVTPTLALAAGVVAHLHTPTLTVGLSALALVGYYQWKERAERDRRWWWTSAVWCLFVLPLVARIVTDPGFPFFYYESVGNRREGIAASGAPVRPRFATLTDFIGTPAALTVSLLCVASALVIALFVRRRAWPALVTFTGITLYSAALLVVSPPQQQLATELIWFGGYALFARGAIVVTLLLVGRAAWGQLGRALAKNSVAHGRAIPTVTAIAGFFLGGILLGGATGELYDRPVSTSGGEEGTYIPAMLHAVTEQADGREIVLRLGTDWISTSAGLLLALERTGTPYCVDAEPWLRARDRDFEDFLTPDRLCATANRERLLVAVQRAGEGSSNTVPDTIEPIYEYQTGDDAVLTGLPVHLRASAGPCRADPDRVCGD